MNNLLGLFVQRQRKIGSIFVDGFLTEYHKRTTEITEYPIELGSVINDHKIINPLELEIEGSVTNLYRVPINEQFRQELGNLPTYITGDKDTRSVTAYRELTQLMIDNEPFDVQTGLISYKNMMMMSLEVNRDKTTSNVLFFTAKFKEVIITITETTTINTDNLRSGKTREQGASVNERGRQNGEELTEDEANRQINAVKNLKAS